MIPEPRLQQLLRQFERKRVLVVGDCMLDEYIWGRVDRISPEAPVMVVEQVETTYAAGGASNVAVNVMAMDGSASLVAVVGDDEMATRLRSQLGERGVRHDGLVCDPRRPTTVKTRVLAHNQQVVRVDRESRAPISPEAQQQIVARVTAQLGDRKGHGKMRAPAQDTPWERTTNPKTNPISVPEGWRSKGALPAAANVKTHSGPLSVRRPGRNPGKGAAARE